MLITKIGLPPTHHHPTVAHHMTIIGSEASYMKKASKMSGVMLKISGLYPFIESTKKKLGCARYFVDAEHLFAARNC